MQWYYSKNGAQFGPVDDAELRRLFLSGAIIPEDFLWNETMGDTWQPASSLSDLFATASDIQPTTMALTDGTTPNRELMGMARESLKGKWGVAVGASLILAVVLIIYLSLIVGLQMPAIIHTQQAQMQAIAAAHQAHQPIAAMPHPKIEIPLTTRLMGYALQLLQAIVTAPLMIGISIFFLKIARRQDPLLSDLAGGFYFFIKAVLTYFLMMLFILLWSLLLIVPGIIAAYSYAMVWFVLAEDTTLSPLQALKKSKETMSGKRWKLFCLQCRFIGWYLLSVLTCYIGVFWLFPYFKTAMTHFYLDVKGRAILPDALATTSRPGIS